MVPIRKGLPLDIFVNHLPAKTVCINSSYNISNLLCLYCRILRDRALYKVTSDFVDAATSGAIGVISRCIPPINPTDPECFHM